ncbi:hypothetical protein [Blastococcus brunescens]|uniref:Uncharacterized protein n=1 Tax=Blastococcus brunescens TaxID=1564165 RepID=A0ABZ1B491_9ACTN|nr:hypothetical protein [Blastococcus sp. BMG 8361]WRL65619.1 hypothetical protein U6N30_08580 [Blastococcus sp. BMG 8361]
MRNEDTASPRLEVPAAPDLPRPARERPPLPPPEPLAAVAAPVDATPADTKELTSTEYRVVVELRDRVSTRLTVEDRNYAPGPRRELTRKLIRDEYDQWLLHEANRGRPAPELTTEDRIFAAVLAELDGLGRLAPLMARDDVEDIHFEGCEPTMLRMASGQLVPGPSIASSDEELEQLLRSIGSRSDDGQTSREFSSASPILNVRLKGVTELGARLQAAIDVLPRPAGVIRVHRFSDPSLDDLHEMNMVDSPVRAFLHAAIIAGASPLVSGAPGSARQRCCARWATPSRGTTWSSPWRTSGSWVCTCLGGTPNAGSWSGGTRCADRSSPGYPTPKAEAGSTWGMRCTWRCARPQPGCSWGGPRRLRHLSAGGRDQRHLVGHVHDPLTVGRRRVRQGADQRAEGASGPVPGAGAALAGRPEPGRARASRP